jgi:hypothetical protein
MIYFYLNVVLQYKKGGDNMKDFGRPSKEAMALALSFVKQTVIPRLIAEQQAKKAQ